MNTQGFEIQLRKLGLTNTPTQALCPSTGSTAAPVSFDFVEKREFIRSSEAYWKICFEIILPFENPTAQALQGA
jgi:hypothetical protein